MEDTNAMRLIMDTNAMRAIMDTAAMQALRDRLAGKSKTVASVVIAFWVVMAIVICVTVFMPHGGGAARVSAGRTAGTTTALATSPVSGAPNGDASRSSAKAETLPVASAVAFGPHGISDGDNPGRAGYVIEADAPTFWQTEWYRTAHFGMLKSGTGLLLDMGRTVTVSGVELKLAPGSADIEIRVGNAESRLVLAATRTSVGGTVYADFAKPATGRYVQIWFTALPRDGAGTYQETVYNVRVSGEPSKQGKAADA